MSSIFNSKPKYLIVLRFFYSLLFLLNINLTYAQDTIKCTSYISFNLHVIESNKSELEIIDHDYFIFIDSTLSKKDKIEELKLLVGNCILHRYSHVLLITTEEEVYLFNKWFKYVYLDGNLININNLNINRDIKLMLLLLKDQEYIHTINSFLNTYEKRRD